MGISWFLAKRIAFNSSHSFSRFIIRLAMVATAISVAVMILALAFVNGFQQAVSHKIFSFWGHVHVQNFQELQATIAEESPILQDDSIVGVIRNMKGVRQVQAFATKSAILKTPQNMEGLLFKGVDRRYDFSMLQPYLQEGRFINFQDSSYAQEIVVSAQTAAALQIRVNDPVIIYFIQPGGEKPRTRKLTVTGIYKTGIEEYDKLYAIGDLRLVQRLNNWSSQQIGGYELFLDDYRNMDSVSEEIFQTLPMEWYPRTIREIYPNIFDWLKLQDVNKLIIVGVMITIAIINLITCLIILVLERTRMVGVLKSVGARNRLIQAVFIWQGLFIAGTGIAWGVVTGLGLCIIQQKTGFLKFWDEAAYYMKELPVSIVPWQVLAVVIGTFLICLLALLLPSLVTRKIQPARAIQFR